MMSNKGNIEEKLQCPYDKSHMILKHRMQTHLVKCARNHPNVRISTCPFNATHRIQEPEFAYHVTNCPDRLLIDKFTYKAEDVQGADVLFPIPKLEVQPAEFWDDQEDVPTYNPEEHCKNNPVLRNSVQTQPGAVRRNFRLEERARMQQFEDTLKSSSKNEQPLGLETLQKQRRPAGKSAGVPDKDKLDICDIMEELTINAGVLTTPKVPVAPQKFLQDHKPNITNENNYPPLDDNDIDDHEFKAAAPWGAASLAMRGMPSNIPSANRSVGRGSFLAKKN